MNSNEDDLSTHEFQMTTMGRKDCKLEVDVWRSLQKQMVAILLTWQLNNNVKFPVAIVTRAHAYDGIASGWRINQSAIKLLK